MLRRSDCPRMELKPFGNGVIVIEPGPIRSEWGQIALDTLQQASRPRLRPAGRGEARPVPCRRRFGVRPRRRSWRDRQSHPGRAPQDPLPCGLECKTSGDSYVTIDLTRCPPMWSPIAESSHILDVYRCAYVHPQLVARYNRSAGRLSKSCFVSRNIFGVGEYHSTSRVVHIAGTKIIGERIPLDNKTLPCGDNFERTLVAGGA